LGRLLVDAVSRYMNRKSTSIAVAVAVAIVIVVIVVMASVWSGLGDTGISEVGWVALVLGAIVTLALGMGLMALPFISNRRDFDDQGGADVDKHGILHHLGSKARSGCGPQITLAPRGRSLG
jgi:hypothetical protein